MTITAGRSRLALALIAWLALQPAVAASQDTLERAKELYGSAAYDEALAILDRLQVVAEAGAAREIALYRAFCLLVLERSDEATKVMEWMVTVDPFYLPSADQASPRLRSVFQDLRRSLLPAIVRGLYTEAKAAFSRKDPGAVTQFDRVIALLDDPDLRGVAALSDLRTLAVEFRDLSAAVAASAAAAQAAQASLAAPPPVPPASAAQAEVTPVPANEDPSISPPVALSQPLPPWSPVGRDAGQVFVGLIEVVIDEKGNVKSATLREAVHPLYDAAVLKLALTWKYKPATRAGVPTEFLKVVRILLRPPT